MNIYLQELKFYRRSTVIWIVVYCLLIFSFLSIFRSFAGDIESTKKLLAEYPQQVLAALNLKVGIFFTIYGFFAYLLTFVWLAGAIQAMNLGVSVLSKEISGKTADFLLSKPISRTRMLVEKLLAVFTLITITNIFYLATALFAANVFAEGDLNTKLFFFIAATMFFVQTIFLALGFLLGAVVPKIKTVISFTLPIVFSFFILSAFGGVIQKEEINYFTPFKYFDVTYIYDHAAYEPKFLYLTLGIILFCVVVSFVVYLRKDIEAA